MAHKDGVVNRDLLYAQSLTQVYYTPFKPLSETLQQLRSGLTSRQALQSKSITLAGSTSFIRVYFPTLPRKQAPHAREDCYNICSGREQHSAYTVCRFCKAHAGGSPNNPAGFDVLAAYSHLVSDCVGLKRLPRSSRDLICSAFETVDLEALENADVEEALPAPTRTSRARATHRPPRTSPPCINPDISTQLRGTSQNSATASIVAGHPTSVPGMNSGGAASSQSKNHSSQQLRDIVEPLFEKIDTGTKRCKPSTDVEYRVYAARCRACGAQVPQDTTAKLKHVCTCPENAAIPAAHLAVITARCYEIMSGRRADQQHRRDSRKQARSMSGETSPTPIASTSALPQDYHFENNDFEFDSLMSFSVANEADSSGDWHSTGDEADSGAEADTLMDVPNEGIVAKQAQTGKDRGPASPLLDFREATHPDATSNGSIAANSASPLDSTAYTKPDLGTAACRPSNDLNGPLPSSLEPFAAALKGSGIVDLKGLFTYMPYPDIRKYVNLLEERHPDILHYLATLELGDALEELYVEKGMNVPDAEDAILEAWEALK